MVFSNKRKIPQLQHHYIVRISVILVQQSMTLYLQMMMIEIGHYSQNAFDDMFEQCFTGSETGSSADSDREYAPLTQWFPNQLERNMNAQEIAASGDLLGAERGNIDWANWANDASISNNWSSRDGPTDPSELERELMILYPELDYSSLTCLNGQPCQSLNDVKLKIFSDLKISGEPCSGLTWSTMDEEGNVREPPPVCTGAIHLVKIPKL